MKPRDRATRHDGTHLMIPNKEFQMLHWFQLFSLEDGWVRERVRNQILYRDDSDLGVWMGDEANELGHMLAICFILYEIRFFFFFLKGGCTSSSSVGMAPCIYLNKFVKMKNTVLKMGYMSVSRRLERMSLIVKYFGGAIFDGF